MKASDPEHDAQLGVPNQKLDEVLKENQEIIRRLKALEKISKVNPKINEPPDDYWNDRERFVEGQLTAIKDYTKNKVILTEGQEKTFSKLTRLQYSLRGPQRPLDATSKYTRPFFPRPTREN